MEWLLYFLWAYHSDPIARHIRWEIYREKEEFSVSIGGQDAAQYARVWFKPGDSITGDFPFSLPIRFTYDCFPRAFIFNMAAGKALTIRGMIMERPANLELTLADWFAHLVGHKLPAGLDTLKYRIEHYRGGI
jgi:hypothetical protein